ncbi:tetratricopeptide repeat protein [Candidatus Nitrospira neomarina]|uniref:Tetratricopeptide repeat protein n=1 Tax=Candidatus Nitrospira neomarina TaxID=3020899 RepID=A0AA96K2E0_9BACT|nr:tetratricopeptide repeat protein [Candidatus Nitrospira neomarina]WNM64036.1 tetratricopeptide repeat protein [Candidatus Nitrospira neomarina]
MRHKTRMAFLCCVVLPFLLVNIANCTQLSDEEKKARHQERGKAYFEEQKYQEALIELKNVVHLDPKDAKAYHQMALIHLKLGGMPDLQSAFGELTKAVELDPSIQDAQLKLGELYLLSQQPQKAKQHAEVVLVSSPNDPKGHLLQGRSLIMERDFEKGIEELKKSLELDPDNEQVYVDLARAYLILEKPEEAEDVLDKGLTKKANSPTLILAKGEFYSLQGKNTEAEALFQEVLALDPENYDYYVKIAGYYQTNQKWKETEEIYQRLATRKPASEVPQMFLGEFYTFIGDGAKASAHFQKGVELNPKSDPARNSLINFYLDNRQWDDVEKLMKPLLEAKSKSIVTKIFEARLILGRGNVDEAIPLFQAIIKDEPNQAMAHQYLGSAFAQKNETVQAIQEFTEAKKLAPQDREVRKALAVARMAERSYKMAIEEAQMAIRLNPRDVQAVHILGQAYFGEKDFSSAKNVYQAIIDQIPQDAIAHFQLGLIDQQDKKVQEAIDHFEEALKYNPDFVQALSHIANIRLSMGEAPQARERVQQQIERSSKNPYFYNLLGRLWMQAKQIDQAEKAFKQALDLNDQLQDSYMNLAELYHRMNRVDEAVMEYERLLDKNPKAAFAHMILGIMAEQRNEVEKAQRYYRKTLEISPKFAPAANNLAWLMAENGGNLDEALAHAEDAFSQQGGNPHIADTLGWIYYKKNAHIKAVSLLGEAVEKLPENPVVRYHLGMALLKKGEPNNAKKTLEFALKMSPTFPGAEEARTTLESL